MYKERNTHQIDVLGRRHAYVLVHRDERNALHDLLCTAELEIALIKHIEWLSAGHKWRVLARKQLSFLCSGDFVAAIDEEKRKCDGTDESIFLI